MEMDHRHNRRKRRRCWVCQRRSLRLRFRIRRSPRRWKRRSGMNRKWMSCDQRSHRHCTKCLSRDPCNRRKSIRRSDPSARHPLRRKELSSNFRSSLLRLLHLRVSSPGRSRRLLPFRQWTWRTCVRARRRKSLQSMRRRRRLESTEL